MELKICKKMLNSIIKNKNNWKKHINTIASLWFVTTTYKLWNSLIRINLVKLTETNWNGNKYRHRLGLEVNHNAEINIYNLWKYLIEIIMDRVNIECLNFWVGKFKKWKIKYLDNKWSNGNVGLNHLWKSVNNKLKLNGCWLKRKLKIEARKVSNKF